MTRMLQRMDVLAEVGCPGRAGVGMGVPQTCWGQGVALGCAGIGGAGDALASAGHCPGWAGVWGGAPYVLGRGGAQDAVGSGGACSPAPTQTPSSASLRKPTRWACG